MKGITRAAGEWRLIPQGAYLRWAYRLELGRRLDLEAPRTFTEKQQWLKGRGERFSALADGAAAREYALEALGPGYLAPLVGLYDRAEQIPWQSLRGKVVARCTHGAWEGLILEGGEGAGTRRARGQLRRWLGRRGDGAGRDPIYRGIRPRVLVERYLGEGEGQALEYRVMCFNGAPEIIQAHQRGAGRYAVTFYAADGRRLGISWRGHPVTGPARLEEGTLLRLLSAGLALARRGGTPYLRADFYWAKERLWFSRLAFSDDSGFQGFRLEAADRYLGGLLRLDGLDGAGQEGDE